MTNVADIKDIHTFKQAAEAYSKDRESLKRLKSILQDKKTEIELKLDSPFYEADEDKRQAMEGARGHIIRRMAYVDELLSRSKAAAGMAGFLMWVVDARDHSKDPWMGWKISTEHPVMWLADELSEEGDPNDLELSHFHPITQEQMDKLSHIERV